MLSTAVSPQAVGVTIPETSRAIYEELTEEYYKSFIYNKLKKLKFVALVRKRTIPTERPPLVGEVSANFFG
jgi:hypothetical protein